MIALVPTYSRKERLRHKDFAEMSVDELEMAKRVIAKMPDSLGMRRTRRFENGKGRQNQMRRLMKDMIRKRGDVTQLPTHRRKEKPRPVVLLCDISGSMERYTRVLLHFMHTLAGSLYQVESFVYSTDITRITRQIRQKNVDDALGGHWRNGAAVGWRHDDRECLHTLQLGVVAAGFRSGRGGDSDYGRLGPRRYPAAESRDGAAATLVPALDLAQSIAGCAEYEPLTRGAQALLPYVHDFLPITNTGESGSDCQSAAESQRPPERRDLSQAVLGVGRHDVRHPGNDESLAGGGAYRSRWRQW